MEEKTAINNSKNDREKKFFTRSNVRSMLSCPGTTCVWDFNSALGDTICEKFESFFVKIVELTNVMIAKGASGYFWILMNPLVFEMINSRCNVNETYLRPNLWRTDLDESWGGQTPMGQDKGIRHEGMLHSKWRLYSDVETDESTMLIGCNWDLPVSPNMCALMNVVNFVI